MKRTLSLLLCALIALSFAFASTTRAQDKITIKFMGWGQPSEQQIFQTVFDEYQKVNPNVTVEYVNVPPGEFLQKLQTLAAADDLPDVFYMADGWFGSWVSRGLLLPIQDMIPADQLKDVWPAAIARYSYDGTVVGQGTLYALPKDLGPFVMVYNKDLFDAKGVAYPATDGSWTWDKALEDYKKLTEFDADGKPVSFGIGDIPPEAVVWTNGADFMNEDRTKVTVDDPLFTEAIQWRADLANVHHVMPNAQDLASQGAYDMWLAGKIGTFVMGPWDQPAFWELPFKWDIGFFPSSPRTMTPAMWTGSMGYAVSAKTAHPKEAVDVLRYLSLSEQGQRQFYQLGQQAPNLISMAEGEFLKWDKAPASRFVFLDNIRKYGHNTPGTYVSNTKWIDTMWQELAPVWDGSMSAADWGKEWAPQLNDILNETDQIRSIPYGNPLPKAK
ncbi:MAG: sugar ABC transporter substrate-binding protein [Anaerolineae bacterium]|nr:sugar ABC transporter substrate-binding protein [Anaerolineae bacterium]